LEKNLDESAERCHFMRSRSARRENPKQRRNGTQAFHWRSVTDAVIALDMSELRQQERNP
jgi:hypothetical protein